MEDLDDDVRPGRYNLRRRVAPVPDILPQPPEPVEVAERPSPVPARRTAEGLTGPAPAKVRTRPNIFGLWKEYDYPPSVDPDSIVEMTDYLAAKLKKTALVADALPYRQSVSCKSHELLLQWYISGSGQKSFADTTRLVETVFRNPKFDKRDFETNDWKKDFAALGESNVEDDDAWLQHDVAVKIPVLRKYWEQTGAPSVEHILDGFRHRRLCGLIRHTLECDKASASWTFEPYRLFVTRPDNTVERVQGQVYWSDTMIEEHALIQQKLIPESKGGALPRCVIALMFGSDSTHLAQFGTSSVWPGYVMFGNEDKYVRARPSASAIHQIAFFEKVCSARRSPCRLTECVPAPGCCPGLHPHSQRWEGG